MRKPLTDGHQWQGRKQPASMRWGVLSLVCLVCGVIVMACGAGSSVAGSAPVIASQQPVSNGTATSVPSGAKPVLGAPGQAFIAKYGPLTSQSDQAQGDLHFKQYPGVAQDYLIVEDGGYFGITPGDADAASILVSAPPGQPWNLTTAKQVCTGFMPTDAHSVRHISVVSQGTVDGWDDVYTSATLAKTFPASSFMNASQNTAPAGSFDINYLYNSSSDTAHVGACTLLVGEQQTQG